MKLVRVCTTPLSLYIACVSSILYQIVKISLVNLQTRNRHVFQRQFGLFKNVRIKNKIVVF
jgi:hypothetical protein